MVSKSGKHVLYYVDIDVKINPEDYDQINNFFDNKSNGKGKKNVFSKITNNKFGGSQGDFEGGQRRNYKSFNVQNKLECDSAGRCVFRGGRGGDRGGRGGFRGGRGGDRGGRGGFRGGDREDRVSFRGGRDRGGPGGRGGRGGFSSRGDRRGREDFGGRIDRGGRGGFGGRGGRGNFGGGRGGLRNDEGSRNKSFGRQKHGKSKSNRPGKVTRMKSRNKKNSSK